MRLPGSRTRAAVIHGARSFVFDAFNFQSTIDLREKHALEDSMGFRGQFDEHRRFQIRLLKSLGLQPSDMFLELGCGPLTAAIPVIEYLDKGHYTGVDIRSFVLNLGWREIGKAGLSAKNPRLLCSDDFANEILDEMKFDFVFSFSVLYHLTDEILDNYFKTVQRRLRSSGKCVANVNIHAPSDRWLEFPFLRRTQENYEAAAARHRLKTTNLGTLHSLGLNGGTEGENLLLVFETG